MLDQGDTVTPLEPYKDREIALINENGAGNEPYKDILQNERGIKPEALDFLRNIRAQLLVGRVPEVESAKQFRERRSKFNDELLQRRFNYTGFLKDFFADPSHAKYAEINAISEILMAPNGASLGLANMETVTDPDETILAEAALEHLDAPINDTIMVFGKEMTIPQAKKAALRQIYALKSMTTHALTLAEMINEGILDFKDLEELSSKQNEDPKTRRMYRMQLNFLKKLLRFTHEPKLEDFAAVNFGVNGHDERPVDVVDPLSADSFVNIEPINPDLIAENKTNAEPEPVINNFDQQLAELERLVLLMSQFAKPTPPAPVEIAPLHYVDDAAFHYDYADQHIDKDPGRLSIAHQRARKAYSRFVDNFRANMQEVRVNLGDARDAAAANIHTGVESAKFSALQKASSAKAFARRLFEKTVEVHDKAADAHDRVLQKTERVIGNAAQHVVEYRFSEKMPDRTRRALVFGGALGSVGALGRFTLEPSRVKRFVIQHREDLEKLVPYFQKYSDQVLAWLAPQVQNELRVEPYLDASHFFELKESAELRAALLSGQKMPETIRDVFQNDNRRFLEQGIHELYLNGALSFIEGENPETNALFQHEVEARISDVIDKLQENMEATLDSSQPVVSLETKRVFGREIATPRDLAMQMVSYHLGSQTDSGSSFYLEAPQNFDRMVILMAERRAVETYEDFSSRRNAGEVGEVLNKFRIEHPKIPFESQEAIVTLLKNAFGSYREQNPHLFDHMMYWAASEKSGFVADGMFDTRGFQFVEVCCEELNDERLLGGSRISNMVNFFIYPRENFAQEALLSRENGGKTASSEAYQASLDGDTNVSVGNEKDVMGFGEQSELVEAPVRDVSMELNQKSTDERIAEAVTMSRRGFLAKLGVSALAGAEIVTRPLTFGSTAEDEETEDSQLEKFRETVRRAFVELPAHFKEEMKRRSRKLGEPLSYDNFLQYSDGSPAGFMHDGHEGFRLRLSKYSKDHPVTPLAVEVLSAIEDRRSDEHSGVDGVAILRAFIDNTTEGSQFGASTIAMQAVKNLCFSPEEREELGMERKVQEMFISLAWMDAMKHEMVFEVDKQARERIFSTYLNTAFFGRNSQGLEAAARSYYDKASGELNKQEMISLMMLLQNPNVYSTDEVKRGNRYREVLSSLRDHGSISQQEYDQLKDEPISWIDYDYSEDSKIYGVNQSVRFARAHAEKQLANLGLESAGGEVTLSIDKSTQDFVAQLTAETVLRWRGETGIPDVGAAVIVFDPHNGLVKAHVGNVEPRSHYPDGEDNNMAFVDGPVGSVLKPLVVAAALEAGVDPNILLSDEKLVVGKNDKGEVMEVENYGGKDYGTRGLRDLIALSLNRASVRLMQKIGPETYVQFLSKLGMRTPRILAERNPIRVQPTIAIGDTRANLEEIAQAYQTLFNEGVHVPLQWVKGVVLDNVDILPAPEPQEKMSPDIARMVVGFMSDDDARKPAYGDTLSQIFPKGIAIKTGTADVSRKGEAGFSLDNWIVTYDPKTKLVVIIRVASESGKPFKNGTFSGSQTAGRLAGKIIARLREMVQG